MLRVSLGSGTAPILRVEGSLTFGQSFLPLRESIGLLLNRRHRHIAIDLSQASTVDSSGVGELVHAYNRVASAGGRLFILTPPARVARLFRLAGLGAILGLGPAPNLAFEAGELGAPENRRGNASKRPIELTKPTRS